MKGFLLIAASLLSFAGSRPAAPSGLGLKIVTAKGPVNHSSLYDSLGLNDLELSRDAFNYALKGFRDLLQAGEIRNTGVISIIDFSLPSDKKRLFVLDLSNGKLLFNTFVAHGKNSGKGLATRFSNRVNSYMSSLGFYITGDPFIGQHGYSLRLEGMEKGINDNALRRSIIMHSAPYVSQDHIEHWGFLGRSEGCPAIPANLNRDIIETIKDGSCLFLYSPEKKYIAHSKFCASENSLEANLPS